MPPQSICSFETCDRQTKCLGLCSAHYYQQKRGRPLGPIFHALPTLEERFWQKVAKDGPLSTHAPHLGACWIWTGATVRGRYGKIGIGRHKYVYSHRFSYTIHGQVIPDGYEVDHLCRVPRCVNPVHLEAVTPEENQRRVHPNPVRPNSRMRTVAEADVAPKVKPPRVIRERKPVERRVRQSPKSTLIRERLALEPLPLPHGRLTALAVELGLRPKLVYEVSAAMGIKWSALRSGLCKNGHPREGNTYTRPGGKTDSCRTCLRAADARRRPRVREGDDRDGKGGTEHGYF